MKKKEIKKARAEAKRKKQLKNKVLLIVGAMFFIFAIFQAIIVAAWFFTHDTGHNKIMLGDKVVTSEVCEQWFSYLGNTSNNKTDLVSFYYEEPFVGNISINHPIPMYIVIDVCEKWKKIKAEVDNNINLCKTYAEMDIINGSYINGSKHIIINNRLVLEDDIKKDCQKPIIS